MEPSAIPEWALWLAGAFGTFMAAFVARLGWKSGEAGKAKEPDPSMRLVGASLGAGFDGTKIGTELERSASEMPWRTSARA